MLMDLSYGSSSSIGKGRALCGVSSRQSSVITISTVLMDLSSGSSSSSRNSIITVSVCSWT